MSKKNGDTVLTLDAIEVNSPDDVTFLEAPDFYYSVKHLEQERLRLLSRVYEIEKDDRIGTEKQFGCQYELTKSLKAKAEEIDRAQQILNDQEKAMQYLAKVKQNKK